MKNKNGMIIILLFIAGNIFGQTKLSENQLKKLDSIATQDVPKNAPGIATAIIKKGNLIFEKYAGIADFKDSLKIDKHTRFNIASNGKQFTALAILTLEDDNKIKLSDDIRQYLPDLYPEIKSKITIGNLLNHSSGIRDVYDLWSLKGLTWWEYSFNNNDVLELIKKQEALNFEPSSKYVYSNTNYILLAIIVEKISGKTFKEYTDGIFQKLNMPNTSFEADYSQIDGKIARAYFNFDKWTTYDWVWNVVGDGNLFSTLTDQIQWEKTIQGYGKSRIKNSIIQKSQELVNQDANDNYGFGLEFGEYKGLKYKFHEGATGAWKATVIRFPKDGISMLTLTNSGKSIPSMQTRQMADVVFDLKKDAKYLVTKPSNIGKYINEDEIIGTYITPNNFTFEFLKKDDGKLYLKRIGRSDIELIREFDNIFNQKFDKDFKQEFIENENGEMQVTAYYTNHSPYTLTRKKSDWKDYGYQALNGKYNNSETDVNIEISYLSNKDYKVLIGDQENSGLLIAPTKLMVNNYVFEFANGTNVVESLSLNTDRIIGVNFERLD
ncbi:beta-lactamase family protein [Subsaximicrobium wynnwilliamsii]|uniref:Beta-lactamase family protein n=1 Tax=Subsaximicrobium wynnwilliamsii TaxID=291179 RepID=A0A5C6ZBM6_9FLAO|nr:serine hydrolase domain-containing protein [Subsaximicrobium wynnwilliamsii]TXD81499.1 beta-lactamase family protein [Subsaximicrobium wynnwilliamsii]TXD87166.1 beta-lactamase family protein [Subsaximicrobium wynnwilliamsii]TXE00859.1 beta-lactamase family protein [Subsaximicrobium wynnwilliamsii]